MFWTLCLVVLLMMSPVSGQSGSKPYSREAAEKSFRALVAAKDPDIIEVISGDGLVCFAESLPFSDEDRFLTIVLPKPTAWFPDTTSNVKPSQEGGSFYDGKTDFPAFSPVSLDFHEWENQDWAAVVDSYLEGKWSSYGHNERLKSGENVWRPYGGGVPVFRFAKDKDDITGATNVGAMQDGSTFNASKTYKNRNNGTTTYEMNLRLSTGRYKERWTPDKGEAMESVGNCYKAKGFVHGATPAKKAR